MDYSENDSTDNANDSGDLFSPSSGSDISDTESSNSTKRKKRISDRKHVKKSRNVGSIDAISNSENIVAEDESNQSSVQTSSSSDPVDNGQDDGTIFDILYFSLSFNLIFSMTKYFRN